MPIYRLSLQEIRGIVVDDDRQRAVEIVSKGEGVFIELIARAMTDYRLRPQLCQPGTTNITPAYWRRNRAWQLLEVAPDGESAQFHMVPRDHDMAPAPYTPTPQEIVGQDLQGTVTTRIPEDQQIMPIIGPVAEDPRLRIHEIILHSPEPMP